MYFTVVIAFVNGYNVKWATYIQNICTVVKLIAIAILTLGGIVKIIQGNDKHIVHFRPHFEKWARGNFLKIIHQKNCGREGTELNIYLQRI